MFNARFLLPTAALAALILAMLVACGGNASLGASAEAAPTTPATAAIVSGVARLPQGEVAPRGSRVHVTVSDSSLADAAAVVIGAADFVVSNPDGVSEIPFRVAYVENRIDLEGADCTVSVRVERWVPDPEVPFSGENKLLYINSYSEPVISRGNPTSGITVPLVPTNG